MIDPARETFDESEAVAAAQAGDLAAFDRLVGRYRAGVVLMARQILGSREAAEDAVQDAFVAAYKSLPQLRDAGVFGGWLGSIVRHRCRRALAGDQRRELPLDRLILAHAPSIQAQVEAAHRDNAVRRAIRNLPDDLRPSVELYYIDDWPVGQIAEFLGLTQTTVKWRLHIARTRLRSALQSQLKEIK